MASKEQLRELAECAEEVRAGMMLARRATARIRQLGIPLDDLPYPATEMAWRFAALYELCLSEDRSESAVAAVIGLADKLAACARADDEDEDDWI